MIRSRTTRPAVYPEIACFSPDNLMNSAPVNTHFESHHLKKINEMTTIIQTTCLLRPDDNAVPVRGCRYLSFTTKGLRQPTKITEGQTLHLHTPSPEEGVGSVSHNRPRRGGGGISPKKRSSDTPVARQNFGPEGKFRRSATMVHSSVMRQAGRNSTAAPNTPHLPSPPTTLVESEPSKGRSTTKTPILALAPQPFPSPSPALDGYASDVRRGSYVSKAWHPS